MLSIQILLWMLFTIYRNVKAPYQSLKTFPLKKEHEPLSRIPIKVSVNKIRLILCHSNIPIKDSVNTNSMMHVVRKLPKQSFFFLQKDEDGSLLVDKL